MNPPLHLNGIAKHFGATIALDGIDLRIDGGEVRALIGENGAGKSTLLNILSGLVVPDGGSMRLGDLPYAPADPGDARRCGIAHIHQELSLCPHLSVAENIFLGAEGSSPLLRREQLARRAMPLLADFGRGEIDPRGRAGHLSLADRQVVEICRALAQDARIILMDEPTSSLQRGDVERFFRLIRQLRARGIAIVYISHFLEEVREICDRYTVLRDGRSVGSGTLATASDDELIAAMVGRSIDTVFPNKTGEGSAAATLVGPATSPAIAAGVGGATSAASNGEVILEVRELASPPRLRSASFALRRGEILGIAGLIGSGRTDLVRTLFGLQRATAGSMTLRGHEIPLAANNGAAQIRRGLGYLSEDRRGEGLAMTLSVADNLTMSSLSQHSVLSTQYSGLVWWISRRRQDQLAAGVVKRLRVKTADVRTSVARLSGGNQQKVAFGRLLHQDPDILLLDEPARGIDIGSKSDIYAEIVRLAREGKAILMVSSYLPELLGVCDRIAVMSRGRLSPARPAGEWTADAIMEAAIGTPSAA